MPSQCISDYYLESMGIVKWVLRKSQLRCTAIQTPRGVVTLLAHIDGPTSDLQQRLWENILDALAYVIVKSEVMAMDDVLIFGEAVSKKVVAKNCVIMHSLAELIAQPQYKAKVWDVIKDKIMAAG